MTDRRIQRFWEVLNKRQRDLTVILEDVHDMHNVAAVMRTCDSVGIKELYIIHTESIKYCKLSNLLKGRKSSGSANKWVKLHLFDDVVSCFEVVRKKYKHIFTTHLSEDAVEFYKLDLTESVALVFGNERDGVSKRTLELSDGNFHIPQVGMIQSLNISVACAVTLYEAFRQRKQAGLYDAPSMSETNRQQLFDFWEEREVTLKKEKR